MIFILVKITSKGPAIIWSRRIGYLNQEFLMPKFRTMHINTPQVATHLFIDPENYITSFGRFLRKYSLDEIPQLYSVIKNDMNFIGPRPALFNQYDLIELRTKKNIHQLLPGITGWAQVNGRDEISIKSKVELDFFYINNKCFLLDIKIIIITFIRIINDKNISH